MKKLHTLKELGQAATLRSKYISYAYLLPLLEFLKSSSLAPSDEPVSPPISPGSETNKKRLHVPGTLESS